MRPLRWLYLESQKERIVKNYRQTLVQYKTLLNLKFICIDRLLSSSLLLFIHSYVNGPLGWICPLADAPDAVMNVVIHRFI